MLELNLFRWILAAGHPDRHRSLSLHLSFDCNNATQKVLNIVSNDDYENYLRKNLTDDPLLDCQKISVPLVQVIALKDTKVPTSTQEDLARACPPHKIIRINQGHVIGSLTNAIKKKEVLHFFQNNF